MQEVIDYVYYIYVIAINALILLCLDSPSSKEKLNNYRKVMNLIHKATQYT